MLYDHTLQDEGKTAVAVRLNFAVRTFKFLPFSTDNNGVFVLRLVVRNFPCPLRSDLALTVAQSESESGTPSQQAAPQSRDSIENARQSTEDMLTESATGGAAKSAQSQTGPSVGDRVQHKNVSVFEQGQTVCVMLNVKAWLGATGKPVMG